MKTKIDYNMLNLLPLEQRIEIEENLMREDLKQSEIAAYQRLFIKELQKHTKPGTRTDLASAPRGTEMASKPTSVHQRTEVTPKSTSVSREIEVKIGRSTEQVGKIFGESKDTVHRRLAIVEAAEEDPEKFKPIVEKMDETSNVNAAYNPSLTVKGGKLALDLFFEKRSSCFTRG